MSRGSLPPANNAGLPSPGDGGADGTDHARFVRVAVLVAGGPPNPTSGGGAVTAWSVVSQLLELGHEVVVCALEDPDVYDPTSLGRVERAEALRSLGADYVPVLSESGEYFNSLPRGPRARV